MAKQAVNGLNSLLGAGVDCEGSARVEGTLRLDGAFRGNLEVGETLIIGSEGSFHGTAFGRKIVIGGHLKGEVMGTELVELQKGARLEGDVLTRSFVVEPGVWFQGNCRMEFTEADEARLKVAGRERESRKGPDGPIIRPLPGGSEGARAL